MDSSNFSLCFSSFPSPFYLPNQEKITSSEATISSCSDVIKNLKPCVSYLVSGIAKPPRPCCSGIKALAATAATSADKKTAC
ncbi:hypothetical protein HN51_044021 [Arachis hypogaea]